MHCDYRLTLSGDLADRFDRYPERNWPGQHAAGLVIRGAVKEFLDREERKNNVLKEGNNDTA